LRSNIESFPQNIFLHNGSAILVLLLETSLAEYLLLGFDIESDLKELLVEERNASLESPSHRRLVRSEAIGGVEVLDTLDALLVEVGSGGSGVEVEIS
jgi:hypothetical protein